MWGGGDSWLEQQFGGLVDLLFPPACPVCQLTFRAGSDSPLMCSVCTAAISPLPVGRCSRCALPFGATTNSTHSCHDCLLSPPLYTQVFAAGVYAGSLKHALQRFKYNGAVDLDQMLARLLQSQIPTSSHDDVILPVPLHFTRLRQRGYNQSLLLARVLAHNLQIQLECSILKRVYAARSQQGLSARERVRNLNNAFIGTRRLDGLSVLLIDDVMTTGATVAACTQALLNVGARSVNIGVVARAPRLGIG